MSPIFLAPLVYAFMMVQSGLGSSPVSSQQGTLEAAFATRTFSAPLFGPRSTGSYRLQAHQALQDRGNLSLWFAGGFPNFTRDFGGQWSGIPWRDGEAELSVGDFFFQPLRPRATGPITREIYPLQGTSLSYHGDETQWAVYAGRAKHFRQIPGRQDKAPLLFGTAFLKRRGFTHYGLSLTTVFDPVFVDRSDPGSGKTSVLSADYINEFAPGRSFFAQLLTSQRGGWGARAGLGWKNEIAELRTTVYSFEEQFPFVDPLYRPGERGVEFSGFYQLSQFASLSGFLDYVADDGADDRSEMRGEGLSIGPSATGSPISMPAMPAITRSSTRLRLPSRERLSTAWPSAF